MNKIRNEIKWAIIFTAMYFGWMWLEKVTGLHGKNIEKHAIFTNLMAIPAVLIFYFALIDKKKNFYNGQMTYRQGLIAGILITVFIALISPLRQYIIATFIMPDYFENAIAHEVASGESTLEEAQSYFNMKSYILFAFLADLFMGFVTSAVVALFTKSKAAN